MPKTVILTCLSPQAKDLIEDTLESIEDPDAKEIFREIIGIVADCDDGRLVGVEIQETNASGRRKRTPTPFNNFIAFCAKGGQKSLTECAREWNLLSDAEKEGFRDGLESSHRRIRSGSSHHAPGERSN